MTARPDEAICPACRRPWPARALRYSRVHDDDVCPACAVADGEPENGRTNLTAGEHDQ
jgi:hypothetical protein